MAIRLHSITIPLAPVCTLECPRTRLLYSRKNKKKNERTLQKKRAFLRLDTERLSGAAEETDGATPSVDGQATSLARYRPFLLRACAAVTQLAALSSLLLG